MNILFIDDDLNNVISIAEKIKVPGVTFSYNFFLISDEVIADSKIKILRELDFKMKKQFATKGFNDLRSELLNNLEKFDILIFDRQFEIPDEKKTGIDLLKYLVDNQVNSKFFYLILTKEARTEGKFFDDLKKKITWLDPDNYLDNSPGVSDNLGNLLNKRLLFFSNAMFLKDLYQNNQKIIEYYQQKNRDYNLKNAKSNPIYLEQISIINFVNSILDEIKYDNNRDIKFLKMIIYWFHLALVGFIEENKTLGELLTDYNTKRDKKYDEIKEEGNLDPIHKIIAFCDAQQKSFAIKLNSYRNNCIHPENGIEVGYENIIYANLLVTSFILGKKDTEYEFSENWVKTRNRKNFPDLPELIKLLKFIQTT